MTQRSMLPRYVVAAVLARMGDAGAGVSMVLLSVDRFGTHGAPVGGVLAAALTAPHLLGQQAGRRVDRARDPRRALAAAGVTYAAALATALAVFEAGSPWLAVAPLLVAGCCGPLLTGGLSSLVGGLSASSARARSVDVLTYGVAGSCGPAAVAGVAALSSPASAVAAVALGVGAASGLFLLLPRPARSAPDGSTAEGSAALLVTVRPLRRVLVTTVTSAAAGGALGVVGVVLVVGTSGRADLGAWVLAAVGAGNLLGSTVLVRWPLGGEPVRRSVAFAGLLAVGYLALAVAPTVPLVFAAAGVIGLLTAPWVTASLAARERYAPIGRRAEVFTGMAGWKIAAASGGTALAGALVPHGARAVMAGAALIAMLGVVVASVDRSGRAT